MLYKQGHFTIPTGQAESSRRILISNWLYIPIGKMMKGVICSVLFMVALVLIMVQPGQAMTCGQVDTLLGPCIPYLTHGGEPGPECCNGVRSIKSLAQNPVEKRQVCTCLKQAANRYSNLKDDAAQSLPIKCGVEMDIPVSRNINCNMIN